MRRAFVLAWAATGLVALGCAREDPVPIAQGFGAGRVPAYIGRPAVAQPINQSGAAVPQHPFMARNGWNSMHGDGPASDTHVESGPLGRDPEVRSTARGLIAVRDR